MIFVEVFEELSDGDVKFSKAVRTTIAQTTKKPSLHDKDALLDFCFGESRQMQVVWEQRRAARFSSHTRSIR